MSKSILPLLLGGGAVLYALSKNKEESTVTDYYKEYKEKGILNQDEIEENSGGLFFESFNGIINIPTDLQKIIYNPEASNKYYSIVPFIVPNSVCIEVAQNGDLYKDKYIKKSIIKKTDSEWNGTYIDLSSYSIVIDFLFCFYVPTSPSVFDLNGFEISNVNMLFNDGSLVGDAVIIEMLDENNTDNAFWYNKEHTTNYYTKLLKDYGQNSLKSGYNVFSLRLTIPYYICESIFANSEKIWTNTTELIKHFNEINFKLLYKIDSVPFATKLRVINDYDTSNNKYYYDEGIIVVRNKPEYSKKSAKRYSSRIEIVDYLNAYKDKLLSLNYTYTD